MASEFLQARQTKFAAYTVFYIVVVIAILSIVNVLADRYNKTYDSTSNKRYSLSDQTAKVVRGLKQDATITDYDQASGFAGAKTLLDQYANLSPKVHVDYVDVDKKPELARAANVKAYGTIVVSIGDRHEPAASATEEGITGAFIRDIKNNVRTICFVEGSGEHRLDDTGRDGLSHFKDLLAPDGYQTQSIDLVTKAEVPATCTAILIAGPSADYQQPEVDAIQKYVQGGGRALIMLDPPLKMGRDQIADNDALSNMLSGWGVTPQKNMILDLNPVGQLAGLGPEVALVTSYDQQPIVSEMKGHITGFPLSRSLDVKSAGNSTDEPMFSSSDSSLATSKLNSPSVDVNDPKNVKGPLVIAAAGSYNAGQNAVGRFVVVGSSQWAANSFIGFNGNRDLAVNTINWLASDEDLISIRPKAPDERQVTLTQSQMNWVRTFSQFVIPLLVIAWGVSVWWRRR
jgi:ABC-type uncharacterized transport system involved in gliding motility auxiliary subunit